MFNFLAIVFMCSVLSTFFTIHILDPPNINITMKLNTYIHLHIILTTTTTRNITEIQLFLLRRTIIVIGTILLKNSLFLSLNLSVLLRYQSITVYMPIIVKFTPINNRNFSISVMNLRQQLTYRCISIIFLLIYGSTSCLGVIRQFQLSKNS